MDGLFHDTRRRCKDLLGRWRSGHLARDVVHVGVVDQYVRGLSLGEVGDRGQRLLVDVDQFQRVLGDIPALGDDQRHRVADELGLALG